MNLGNEKLLSCLVNKQIEFLWHLKALLNYKIKKNVNILPQKHLVLYSTRYYKRIRLKFLLLSD